MQSQTKDSFHSSSSKTKSSRSQANKNPTASKNGNEFLRLVERAEAAFQIADDSQVDEVQRILSDVRTQYDHVHMRAEKLESELTRLREGIRIADQTNSAGNENNLRREDLAHSLEKQHGETLTMIFEAKTAQKVYGHMLGRITKEQALLKEKLLIMEGHLERKHMESARKTLSQERVKRKAAQVSQSLDIMLDEVEHERAVRDEAHHNMLACLQAKMHAKLRRTQFEEWRHTVALDAANEAFNASAGRLRKIYAVEKLAGNCLQKVNFDQLERSAQTEDGFQRIREVTGLTDVMDIVHKFLNRDVEHEQLKSSVKEAELRLETLRDQYDRLKRDTDGLTLDTDVSGRTRSLYQEVEEHETKLNQISKEHEESRARVEQSTMQIEHMKRWSGRMGKALIQFEPEPVRVDKPGDLINYFQQIQRAIDKFIAHIVQQISSGKVQRKNMSQVASKEYHEASRLLTDKDFLKANCRVPASLDIGTRTAQSAQDDDTAEDQQQLRDDTKNKSKLIYDHALREMASQQKKKPKGS